MMRTVELRFGIATLVAILAQCCPTGARAAPLSEIRELLPEQASVLCHVQANLDATPEKEWVVAFECDRAAEFDIMVFRRMRDGWVKALRQEAPGMGGLDLEVRDLDNDRMLEVIVWAETEDGWCFDTVDFVDGKLRLVQGLYFSDVWRGTEASGFFDIDGDRKLELVAPAMIPGYLTALFPTKKRVFTPYWAPETSDRDLRIYRFIKGKPVLYFPPLEVLPEGLKRGLASGYSGSRQAAAQAAGILRVSETLPRLLALVNDPESGVASAAIDALAQIGGPLAVAGIISALEEMPWTAAQALAELDDERAAHAVLELRNSEHPELRCVAMRALGRRGGPEAIRILCRYLQDSDLDVSHSAAEALEGWGTDQAADEVAEVMRSSSGEMRALAARTLAHMSDPRAAEVLLAMIEQGEASSSDFALLGEVGDEAAVAPLLRYVRAHGPGEIAPGAVRALCELGDEAVADELAEIFVHIESVPGGGDWHLGPMRCARIVAEDGRSEVLVRSCLKFLDEGPPWDAAELLALSGSAAAVAGLIDILTGQSPGQKKLDSVNWPLRSLVARTLGQIGDPRAIPALREAAAQAQEPEAARSAKWALVELGAPEALSILLEWSRAGDTEATLRLARMEGDEAREEVLRALRESSPDGDDASRWGETMADSGWGPGEGWFRKVARRLGKAAVPILISRLQEVAPSEKRYETPCVAAAAAHCLRELGAVEAIPVLLKVAVSHPNETAREVVRWSVVALRRQDAKWREPLFPEVKQQPLEAYLGPGGPWRVVDYVIANLDGDPEGEFAITYRDRGELLEPGDRMVEAIVALDWQGREYVATQSVEPEAICEHTEPLQLRDVNGDGVPEVLLEGDRRGAYPGLDPALGIYGFRHGGLRLLGWFEGRQFKPRLADLDGDGTYEVLEGYYEIGSKQWAPSWYLSRWDPSRHKYGTLAAHPVSWPEISSASEHRAETLAAADMLTDTDAVSLLRQGTKHPEARVREACVQALGWIGTAQLVPILAEALGDQDEAVRHAATAALERIGSPEALAALRETAAREADR